MRIGPLLALIVVAVLFLSSLGQAFLWVVAGVSVLALVVLIAVTARANRFFGPKVLIDDARERWDRFGKNDPASEADPVAVEPVIVAVEPAKPKESKDV